MKRIVLAITSVIFLSALGVAQLSPVAASDAAPAAVLSDDPPSPPEGVSPADPAMDVPDPDGWRCPHCGAALPHAGWRAKAPYGRPALGPGGSGSGQGAERYRPGRYGRSDANEGRTQGPRHGMHGRFAARGQRGAVPAERMLRHAEELKLTDEQIDRLEKLSYETRKTIVDLHAEVEKEQLEVHNLLQTGSDDVAAIKTHLAAASQARANIQLARVENLIEAKKVLTEKQKKAIKESYPRLGVMID